LAAVPSVGRAIEIEPLRPVTAPSSIEALYRRHSPNVFSYCLSLLGRREDAEDAVQTTYLHAARGLERGVVPAVEVAWLLGIARNVCRARWEVVGRRSRLELTCDPSDLDRSPAAAQERPDELFGLEGALAQLPEQQRRAVLLRDWRGLPYEEIAEQLGVSHAAVATLIFRGRRTLSELLSEVPREVKSRLRSLGDLGSVVAALKGLFGGATVAVGVAVVSVSAGLAGDSAAPQRAASRAEPARTVVQPEVGLPSRGATAPVPPGRAAAPPRAESPRAAATASVAGPRATVGAPGPPAESAAPRTAAPVAAPGSAQAQSAPAPSAPEARPQTPAPTAEIAIPVVDPVAGLVEETVTAAGTLGAVTETVLSSPPVETALATLPAAVPELPPLPLAAPPVVDAVAATAAPVVSVPPLPPLLPTG
jgi:RNA polymerase sigma-70 factor (ECF subfamily)